MAGRVAHPDRHPWSVRDGRWFFAALLAPCLTASFACRPTAKTEAEGGQTGSEQGIGGEPESAVALNNRGEALRKQGEYARAIREYDAALRLDPKLGHAWNNRGLAKAALGDTKGALPDYDEAIRLDPALAAPFANRAVIWAGRGEYAKAVADYDAATRLNRELEIAYKNRAWIRATCPDAALRDGAKAVEDAKRACELSGWSDPTGLATLAAAYAESGEFEEAVRWQTQALADPDYARKYGEPSRRALSLYKEMKPYRDGQ